MALRDMLRFDKLYGPGIIRIVYVVGVVLGIVAGLFAAVGALIGLGDSIPGGLFSLIVAILTTVLGLALWRVVCELWIVTFGIYDRLGDIKANIAGGLKG